MRELGDWLILFGNVLERIRFVRGGQAMFDGRSFITRYGAQSALQCFVMCVV